jgi:hypothetical protein
LRILALVLLFSVGAVPLDERRLIPVCAAEHTVPPAPGSVVRLFELHKDRNPQNVLVIHTYADARCRLIGSPGGDQRLVDMYWRMNAGSPAECYKPTHPTIKSETWKTLEVTSLSADRRELRIEITPLDQLEHDLPTREVEIALVPSDSGCSAEVRLPLGSRATMRLREIHAEASAQLIPVRRIEALELVGLDERDRSIRRRYRAK